jgi:D-3-phosphoglycerate dehydrogenase
VAHPDASGRALSVLTVSSPVPEHILDDMRDAVGGDLFRQIELVEA